VEKPWWLRTDKLFENRVERGGLNLLAKLKKKIRGNHRIKRGEKNQVKNQPWQLDINTGGRF